MKNISKKGFTLVELLVVISIIGLLSTIAVVSLGAARSKARDAKRIADMKQVSTSLEQFYADQGGYPAMTAALAAAAGAYPIGVTGAVTLCGDISAAGAAFAASCGANTTYMGRIPPWPTSPTAVNCNGTTIVSNYCYGSDVAYTSSTKTATTYSLEFLLEATNPAAGITGKSCTITPNGMNCV
jgi:prepilin-type N-terminal cleavage/methylation domain-containing protein